MSKSVKACQCAAYSYTHSRARIPQPTAAEFAAASVEAQTLKTSQPGSSRKHKQGDLLEEGGVANTDHVAGPAHKKRGQVHTNDSLQLSNEAMLRSLMLGLK